MIMRKKSRNVIVYRVTYRLRKGILVMLAEITFKSKKKKEEIDFRKLMTDYLENSGKKIIVDEVIAIEEINKK